MFLSEICVGIVLVSMQCSGNLTSDGSTCCDSYVSVILELVLHPFLCNNG